MKNYWVLLLLGLGIVSCVESEKTNEQVESEEEVIVEKVIETQDETAFIHTVFFWMDSTLKPDQMIEFESGMANLLNIETIYRGYYGPPAMTPREVVDNSYDFAFVVHFKSKEDHDKYQQDSLHLQFIADYKTYWSRIQIYDNLVK